MFETMAAFMLVEHANGAMFSPPLGPAFYPRAVAPNRKPYRTKDGLLSALIYNDKQWAAFMDAVQPAWASEDYATLAQRVKHLNTIYGLVAGVIEERTTDEWLELFQRLDIPASPIRTPAELLDNAHLKSAGFFETVESPYGPVRFPGVPTWFSRTPGAVAGAAPALGAHTDEVLEELAHLTGAVGAATGST